MPFLQHDWPLGDPATRARVFEAHKWWTAALLYYLGMRGEAAVNKLICEQSKKSPRVFTSFHEPESCNLYASTSTESVTLYVNSSCFRQQIYPVCLVLVKYIALRVNNQLF